MTTIFINNSNQTWADYIGWAPTPCTIQTDDTVPRQVILRNQSPNQGGQVVLMKSPAGPVVNELEITLQPGRTASAFFIGAKMNPLTRKAFASASDKDAAIAVTDKSNGTVLAVKAFMVRMRKNANELTDRERNNFLSAMVRLNKQIPAGQTQVKYLDFQNMHDSDANREIHGRASFLPWHRAMLLDLERRLQQIDASITLPYWKFDAPAPYVFTKDFIGWPTSSGIVDFSSTNPMISWELQINGVGSNKRIERWHGNSPGSNDWNPTTQGAYIVQNTDELTIGASDVFDPFRTPLEDDPHGSAHVSFNGQLSKISQAPADPLFFLLHANIDRLWAKWQWTQKNSGFRYNSADRKSYPYQGVGQTTGPTEQRAGNFTQDTLWPWNGINRTANPSSGRPPTSPGGPFPASPLTTQPGNIPALASLIDFQGNHSLASNLMYCFDDVPYEY